MNTANNPTTQDTETAQVTPAEEFEKRKIELLSLLGHQFWTPLTIIKGYTSMIMEGSFGKTNLGTQDALRAILDSSQELIDLTENYLHASRIELGKMPHNLVSLDLGKLVERIANKFRPLIERKGLELALEIENQEIVSVIADVDTLGLVISNLIDNALKYTEKGRISISVSKVEGRAKVSITDTGIGIAPETMPVLFKKFSRGNNASQANIAGIGLGLYIAKRIVEAHQGHIWAESEGAGHGSTFVVEL